MKSSKPIKDDYCEPWDSTIKTDATNVSSKKQGHSDDEHNEYLDPYDTGREGIIEKRMSRGIGREFGVPHGKVSTTEQRRSAVDDPRFVFKLTEYTLSIITSHILYVWVSEHRSH
jgi:hypothetical protein